MALKSGNFSIKSYYFWMERGRSDLESIGLKVSFFCLESNLTRNFDYR